MNIPTILACLSTIIVYSCQSTSTTKQRGTCQLTGTYINTTVLDKCPDAMPVDVPHYALVLTFKGTDSVEIDNGVERYYLPFIEAEDDCLFKISGASLYGDMFFEAHGDSAVLLADSAWTKLTTHSTFSKFRNEEMNNWRFDHYLNECILSGKYRYTNAEGRKFPVEFLPNGQVSGLRPFLSYDICYAGDCLEETMPPASTIEFLDDKGQKSLFVFKRTVEGTLQLYRVGDPIPDIKGERTIGELAYEIVPHVDDME